MKRVLIVSIMVLTMFLTQHVFAEPIENDFGVINAWYNDQEATVENVQLKIGEPAEITVSINSKIDCNVYVELTNPLVTVPYEVVKGPSEIDESIDNYGVKAGWEKKYIWTIIPNGDWTQGTAPINIFVQFSDRGDYRIEEFTIANPYILDEQYSSLASTRTATAPSSTDQPPSQGSPGFGVVGALLGMLLAVRYGSGKA